MTINLYVSAPSPATVEGQTEGATEKQTEVVVTPVSQMPPPTQANENAPAAETPVSTAVGQPGTLNTSDASARGPVITHAVSTEDMPGSSLPGTPAATTPAGSKPASPAAAEACELDSLTTSAALTVTTSTTQAG